MIKRAWAIFFLMPSTGLVAGPAPSEPLFVDCAKAATPDMRQVCTTPDLREQDRLMRRLYALAQSSAFGVGPSNQQAAQREWFRWWTHNSDNSDPKNLRNIISERNRQLATAILFSHPDVALPVLRRLDPEGAAMIEATYLYVRGRGALAGSDRARIAALLKPYVDQKNGAWGTVETALANDSGFAEFVGVRSAYLSGDGQPLPFPCSAVVRKPRLLDATSPRFGSNMDNFVARSDCEETLPPLPKFSALADRRSNGMTDCGGGSIRFAYYKSYSNAVLAARLATGGQLRPWRAKPMPRRRGVTAASIAAAEAELSAYYVRYRRATAQQAPQLARQMIFRMLEQAWQC